MRQLIAFDLDGTLVEGKDIWTLLDEQFGCVKEDKELFNLFQEGKISYEEWIKRDIEMYNSHGANRSNLASVISHLRLSNGALELLTSLKRNGNQMILVSDGIDLVLQQLGLEKFFDYLFINRFQADETGITSFIPTPYHFDDKPKALHPLIPKYDRVVFIGNGSNDVAIVKYVKSIGGLTIAVDGSEDEIKHEAKYRLKTSNLTEILEIIN